MRRLPRLAAGIAAAGSLACPALAAAQNLVGTFAIAPGTCTGGKPHGTWFRMIFPGGSPAAGRFFANPDSSCSDKTYTLATPGRDGGLATGRYQPPPTPAFDSRGNSRARAIIGPASFSLIQFGVATSPRDAATGARLPAPSIQAVNGRLRGQLQAFTAQWNRLTFNQGSPKPDGSRPGITSPVRGRYDARTRRYVLEWTSAIVGGPFNGFTGLWHFEGTFKPAR